jgi:hypothetical protein
MSSEFPLDAQWADVMIPIRHSGGVADALLDPDSDLQKLLPSNTVVTGVDLNKPEALAALLEQVLINQPHPQPHLRCGEGESSLSETGVRL